MLDGVKIGITGTEKIAKKQEKVFLRLGAEPIWITRSIVKKLPFELDLSNLSGETCWLVFTSANGVNIFFNQIKQKGILPETIKKMKNFKYAVIGSATGAVLETYGITVNLCPEIFTSEGLAKELVEKAKKSEKIFLLRSVIGSPVLLQILKENGFSVQDIATYELETGEMNKSGNIEEKLNYITFSSASGVEQFFRQYDRIPEGTKPVCIGPVSAKALEKYTKDFLIAKEISVEGIVQTILEEHLKG